MEATLTDIHWTIPGSIFSDYTADDAKGKLTAVPAGDLEKASLSFYWADTADGREIKVTFKHDGHDCEVKASIDVKKPVCTFTAEQGTTQFKPAAPDTPTTVGLYDDPEHGIRFTATVDTPAGFAKGTFCFAQLVTYTDVKIRGTDDHGWYQSIPNAVVDVTFPFSNGAPSSWSADGTTEGKAYDGPYNFLANYKQVYRYSTFLTYVMFKPDGGDGRWVPLQTIDWGLKLCCGLAPSSNSWLFQKKGQMLKPAAETTTHPEWDANITGYPLTSREDPPPTCVELPFPPDP